GETMNRLRRTGSGREAEKRARPTSSTRSRGGQGRVQCDSYGTFDTRGTVRTRRSRSIKPAQRPAADRAAGQQGIRRTTHAQQSTRGICPHSHWEESSRQQVDKDLAPLNCKGWGKRHVRFIA